MSRSAVAFLLAGVVVQLWAVGSARAESAWVHLEWDPPRSADCPPRAVLEHDVEQALDRSVFTTLPTARMTVRALVEQGDDEITVRLDARSDTGNLLGTRELRGSACASLRNSIGLVLTLLVEREAGPPEPRFATTIAPGLWSGVLLNVLPRAAVGVGPALSLRLTGLPELHVELAYWLPIALETDAGKRAVVHGVSVAPRLCPRLAGSESSRLDLRLCGGARLGTLIVIQTRPDVSGATVQLLAQALVELRSAVRFGSDVRLELAVGPVLTLHRTSLYAVQEDGARSFLYRMPVLGVFVGLGLII